MTHCTQWISRGILALTLLLIGVPAQAQFSTPVRDVENPARTPFWANATINISVGFGGVLNSPIATLDPGERLVLEQVSVRCTSPAGNGIVRVLIGVTEATGPSSWTTRSFEIPIQFQGTDPFSGPTYVGGISSRIYSDPIPIGASVVGGVIRATGTGSGFCTFALSGYTLTI